MAVAPALRRLGNASARGEPLRRPVGREGPNRGPFNGGVVAFVVGAILLAIGLWLRTRPARSVPPGRGHNTQDVFTVAVGP